MKFDVITVGSNTVDIFANTGLHEVKKMIAYPVGSKILINDTNFSTGGGGTNTAVAFSRLGLKTAYLGKVSNDHFGCQILDELKKEKIKFIGARNPEISAYSIILDSKEHNRTILTYKGASNNLKFKDLKLRKLKTKWFYFSSMLGDSFVSQKKLAKFASQKGIKIAFNPSSYQTKYGTKPIAQILRYSEVLILNKEEARMLVNEGDLYKGLRKLGPKIICVTDGKKGMFVYNGEFLYSMKPHPFTAKERTGAGDAFASSFVAGLVKGLSIEKSMQVGLANAESVILFYGAKNKLLNWKGILDTIRKRPVKIKKRKY